MRDGILAKPEPETRMVSIVGPTAVGKTELALRLAPALEAEVISVDAMQVYRGMDIGTSKPTAEERGAVPFHMIDVVDPSDNFSVAAFKELADDAIFGIASRGKLPLLAGGSGLYYRAVVDDLDFANIGGADRFRVEIEEELKDLDDLELHDLLADLDPKAAGEIPARNRKRVMRAVEMAREGDRLMSERQHAWSDFTSPYDLVAVGLEMERHALYGIIEGRVDAMMEVGLEKEVLGLRAAGLSRGTTAGEALGYRQILEHLDGLKTLDEAVDEIKRRTRNYAKRQLTWFRSDLRVKWFEVPFEHGDAPDRLPAAIAEAAQRALEYITDNLEN